MLLRKRPYSEYDSYGGYGDVIAAADAGQFQYASAVCSVWCWLIIVIKVW